MVAGFTVIIPAAREITLVVLLIRSIYKGIKAHDFLSGTKIFLRVNPKGVWDIINIIPVGSG
jgi:hypothetical protein